MEDQHQPHQHQNHNLDGHETLTLDTNNNNNNNNNDHQEPAVRSRWTPKPEQILILESIFNSGMVNPPKEETVRIRKLLEKFGAVGDANVFYWFQNRRSRSRRRQRQQQMQQTLLLHHHHQMIMPQPSDHSDTITFAPPENIFDQSSSSSSSSFYPPPLHTTHPLPLPSDHLHHMHFFQSSGYVSVFINGVPTEVPKGPIEVKSMFGEDVVLVHSSGLPLPTNEFGILLQTLLPGESYFLVPRPTLSSN